MSKHIICVYGCDDYAAVPMDLTDSDLAAIEKLVDAVNAAAYYGCKPTMDVESKDLNWDKVCDAYIEDIAKTKRWEA